MARFRQDTLEIEPLEVTESVALTEITAAPLWSLSQPGWMIDSPDGERCGDQRRLYRYEERPMDLYKKKKKREKSVKAALLYRDPWR